MYRWIQRWGEMAGLPSEEILARLADAWEAAAPADAVYQEKPGVWKTIADLGEGALASLGAHGSGTPGMHPASPGMTRRIRVDPS